MAKQIVQDTLWGTRIKSANKYYDQWEALFKCKVLSEYYEGQQWKSQRTLGYEPYVINKFYETIQIKISNFIPTFPKFNVTAKPGNSEWNSEGAGYSSRLKQDTLNSIIQDDRALFHEEMEMAYKDSFFRFGMVEVGYSADWIMNPNVQKPLLAKDTEQNAPKPRKIVSEPEELPVNERIYFKHISAERFRVGGIDHKYLERCSWCGYYDYVYKDDLLAMKIMNRDKVENTTGVYVDYSPETNDRDVNRLKGRAVKLWHLWDLRSRMQLLVLDSPCVTIYQRKFKRLPLFDYRPDRRLITEGFYPIPVAYNWLSPQNEINETREMLRTHRRRFVRKFQVARGSILDEEMEKFETGPDGAIIQVEGQAQILPIQNADLGNAVAETMETSADDLDRISGESADARGVPNRTTATEAKIIQGQANSRVTSDRDRIVKWFVGIGREALLLVRDKFTLGTYAKLTQPEGGEPTFSEMKAQNPGYAWVTSEDLNDGYDFAIDVDVTTISAEAQQEEKQTFLEFLSTLTQFPVLAFSPILVRYAADAIGFRNQPALKELQKMALLMEQGRMLQLQAQASPPQPQPPPGNAGQQIVANQTPPNLEQARNQIQNQLGVTG
jgi:hypothetical protein